MSEEDVAFGEESEDEMNDGEVREWAEKNFKAVKNKIESVTSEMRNSKPQENISVRKVDTDEGERIVVEYSVQRWYSPQYFKKMLESNDENNENSSEIF